MDPILKYPGAKWRIAEWIIGLMPPHDGYLELCFGSGAVFFNKPPSRIETINDIDGEVVRFFRTCRERPDDLAEVLALTPWAREEFHHCEFCDGQHDDVEAARQFMVREWMTFGARASNKTEWRHTTGSACNGGPNNAKLWQRMPERIIQVAERLRDALIENKPAVDLIPAYNGPELLIYADPLYLKSTRTLNGDQYRHEMTDRDHIELLEALRASNSMVLLSGYDCDMYRDMLCDWSMTTRQTTAERGVRRTECLWINPVAMDRRGMLAII